MFFVDVQGFFHAEGKGWLDWIIAPRTHPHPLRRELLPREEALGIFSVKFYDAYGDKLPGSFNFEGGVRKAPVELFSQALSGGLSPRATEDVNREAKVLRRIRN